MSIYALDRGPAEDTVWEGSSGPKGALSTILSWIYITLVDSEGWRDHGGNPFAISLQTVPVSVKN